MNEMRIWACNCVRRELIAILRRESLVAVEVALRFAIDEATSAELWQAWTTASAIARDLAKISSSEPSYFAAEAAAATALNDAVQAKLATIDFTASAHAAARTAGGSPGEFEKARKEEKERLKGLRF